MVSALYVLDENADIIISRQYTIDLSNDFIIDNFKKILSKNYNSPPIICFNGLNYIYITINNVYIMAVAVTNCNIMSVVNFLNKLTEILKSYFNSIVDKDLFLDNFNFIYELFDEIIDFGIIQNTDFAILKELIKLKINKSGEIYSSDGDSDGEGDTQGKNNEHKETLIDKIKKRKVKDKEAETSPLDKINENSINSSILRTSINKINWRQKGIFYAKNEFFIDFNEKVSFTYNLSTSKIVKNAIEGELVIKSYLSGMPILKLGLNDKLSVLKNLNFNQCVELPTFHLNKLIKFIPPDQLSNLITYNSVSHSQPLIMVEPTFKVNIKESKIQLLMNLKTHFKKKLQLKQLTVKIPINSNFKIDFNNKLKFKSELGKVEFKIDEYCIVWKIDTVNGMKEIKMISELNLLSTNNLIVKGKMNLYNYGKMKKFYSDYDSDSDSNSDSNSDSELDNFYNTSQNKNKLASKIIKENALSNSKNSNFITCKFSIPNFTYSGIKINYLKIEEPQLNYPSFPWVKYTLESNSYEFKVGINNYELLDGTATEK